MANLSLTFLGAKIKNPIVLASGILGVTKASLANVVKNGAGAVTIKSISKDKRKGHNNPIIITFETGMMNAVGYSNPGIDAAKEEFANLNEVGAPVFASIIGTAPEDFAYMAENFLSDEYAAVEVPLSCPHTPGFGTLAGQGTPEAIFNITKAIKEKTDLPIIIKLSPNSQNLGEVAKAAESAGASAINMGNTHGPGMVINLETRKPILDFKVGGVSGPAIRPITVRCIYDVYKAVKIPIIGTGGVNTGRDAIEMMMAGASMVGVGTAVYYRGISVFKQICDEMKEWMEGAGVKSVEEIIGAAHE
ncbi:MAG: dihydroorotate dehydrogenase [Patescibacteria group bacterium]|jgi:dihydroorotate dehydrogenase (NAD+) catalytic subunit